ncbi:YdeI/OmpD-associated family protein [Acidicapsa acidisoli]|uniref:YdeI/OmpD-associated family protein n=1 Tax=Acidicapsa acidisoli TaxID=1615681 RepID=UPI0021DF5E07|nr:YdeI/OmpD-associated family protein [Acidicapsa acidisoli]
MSATQTPAAPKARTEARIDLYISKAKPFAQPILIHLRELVHKACPNVVETIKWSRPFFEYKGVILANMSAFNEHCSFGFWGEEIGAVLREANVVQDGGMGSLGRITSVKDLPSNKQMLDFLRQATAFVDNGQYTSPIAARNKVVKAPKPPVDELPREFAVALKANKKASTVFAAFSPSCKREYIEWIADAKRAETRDKRIATAVEWIAEGKQRNWKYQNC